MILIVESGIANEFQEFGNSRPLWRMTCVTSKQIHNQQQKKQGKEIRIVSVNSQLKLHFIYVNYPLTFSSITPLN